MARRSSLRANCRLTPNIRKTPFRRLMIAQDTGSAIVGPARADLYFGAGADAGKVSGRLRHSMRFVMLVPNSLDPVMRARKLPVPDERPSEKIARLFPQTDPQRTSRTAPGLRRSRRLQRARTRPVAQPQRSLARPGRRHRSPLHEVAAAPVPLRRRGPMSNRLKRAAPPASLSLPHPSMKRIVPMPDLSAAPRAQARPQRGGARAVGQRRKAGQAVAQASCGQGASATGGDASRR
mgnify:CR=1 FL=1